MCTYIGIGYVDVIMRTAIFHEVGPVSVVTMATYPPQHNLSCVKYLVLRDIIIVSMIRLKLC